MIIGLSGAGIDNITSDAPCLAVCFANGLVQIFQHERDEGKVAGCVVFRVVYVVAFELVPVLVETQMKVATMQWSSDGRLLAIVGECFVENSKRERERY